jgi:integrase
VALKVDNIAPSGYAADRASVRQKKTGRPVKFELTEATRRAVDDYLKATGKKPGEYLFTGRRKCNCSLTTRQYARLLTELARQYRLGSSPVWDAFTPSNKSNPHLSAHGQPACRSAPMSHTKIESTVRYLGIEVDDALAIAEQIDV